MTIPTNLIENALNLTGKTMEEMQTITPDGSNWGFSIEKFCFYLLSPEFIEKYSRIINGEYYFDRQEKRMSKIFGEAIYEYQRKDKEFPEGNPDPLISLLEKIGTPKRIISSVDAEEKVRMVDEVKEITEYFE